MSDFKMSLDRRWRRALFSILQQLTDPQFTTMKFHLDQIPQGLKTNKTREEIPDLMIQHYGIEGSISEIDKIMKKIPRNDPKVHDLLRPFVENLKEQGKKRKREEESVDVSKHQSKTLDQPTSSQPDKVDPGAAVKPKKKTEKKTEKQDGPLKSAESSKTSKTSKPAAVQTGRILMKEILKSNKTNTHLVVELNGQVQTVFMTTRLLANALGLEVDDGFERRLRSRMPLTAHATLQGNKMISINVISNPETSECASTSGSVAEEQQPDTDQERSSQPDEPPGPTIHSIKAVKSLPNKTTVNVQGTITKMNRVTKVNVKSTKKKVNKKELRLKDKTGSIDVVMWRDATEECRRLSVGDVVTVTNTKTNEYQGNVSLNSTGHTKITKVVGVKPKKTTGSRPVPKTSKTRQGASKATPTEDSVPAEDNVPAEDGVPAKKKLLKVRSEFAKRASGPVLNQLLDKLLEGGFIIYEEMNSVLTNKTSEDKARALIDLVWGKGNEASALLIQTLCEVDQFVAKELKLI